MSLLEEAKKRLTETEVEFLNILRKWDALTIKDYVKSGKIGINHVFRIPLLEPEKENIEAYTKHNIKTIDDYLDNTYYTMLHYAVIAQHATLVEMICSLGADIEAKAKEISQWTHILNNSTPLQLSVWYPHHKDITNILLKYGANRFYKNDENFKAEYLMLSDFQRKELIKKLVSAEEEVIFKPE